MSEIVFIYGAPGSGKSTIAAALAENNGYIVFDLDKEIESASGRTIPDLIDNDGIDKFRAFESETLRKLVGKVEEMGTPVCVSLGGGALLDQKNRELCEIKGKIVFVDVSRENLIARNVDQDGTRPLLAGDITKKLNDLLNARAEHYDSFKIRVGNDEKIPTSDLLSVISNSGVFSVGAMGNPYEVLVYRNASKYLHARLKRISPHQKIGLVFDTNTHHYYGDEIESELSERGYDVISFVIPAGEEFKNLQTVQELWNFYIDSGFDRKSVIVAIGGGVVSDLVGFASATYMRGCQWVCVPTTLLSMVDASIGGKTGFDLPNGKNLVGSFYPPRAVIIDPRFIDTLPEDEFRSGMAEVIKHGIITDPSLFEDGLKGIRYIKEHLDSVIPRAVKVKVDVIEEDPFEQGVRASLNLGHTIGHGVELASDFELKHGEAVAIGMVKECIVAEKLGIAEAGLADRIRECVVALGLPYETPTNIDKKMIVKYMWNDKKKSGKAIRFALPAKIGKVVTGIEISELEELL